MLQIIISPAKKMNVLDDYPFPSTEPLYIENAKHLYGILQDKSLPELKKLWQCSDKLAEQNYERLKGFSPAHNQTPCLLSYEGIQYQYMAPEVFSDAQWDYANRHLRILSGLYGILRPTDGVIPYRLEMQAKLSVGEAKDLYHYWGDTMYRELLNTAKDGHLELINLASAEYSKTVLPYLSGRHTSAAQADAQSSFGSAMISCITCVFGELINDKVKVKATQAKMARGEMVRWMAEHNITSGCGLKQFDSFGYRFEPKLSSDSEYIFLKPLDQHRTAG